MVERPFLKDTSISYLGQDSRPSNLAIPGRKTLGQGLVGLDGLALPNANDT